MHIPGAVLVLRKFREFEIYTYVLGLLTSFMASTGIFFSLQYFNEDLYSWFHFIFNPV